MIELLSSTREELEALFLEHGIKPAHTKSFMRALHEGKDALGSFLTSAPKAFSCLLSGFTWEDPDTVSLEHSEEDKSCKFILRLFDGKEVESVLIPEKGRLTLCVSSQVGCAQKCVFCYTGKMGLKRNLLAHEILAQVRLVNQWLSENRELYQEYDFCKVTNVVFMGMGEPLDNVGSVSRAIELLKDPWAFGIAPRRITVSTAGHLDGLRSLIKRDLNVSLALSLHAPNNALRSRLMPISKENFLGEVLSEMEAYAVKRGRKVFLQYTLFEGVNDKKENAEELIELLKDRPFKVNLIPFNEVIFSRLRRPSDDEVRVFQDLLIKGGVRTTVRFSKGRDIKAACGQLNRKLA